MRVSCMHVLHRYELHVYCTCTVMVLCTGIRREQAEKLARQLKISDNCIDNVSIYM